MQIFQGFSQERDSANAALAATAGWQTDLDIVFVFFSSDYNPKQIASALDSRFPGVKVVGCTTSGEILGEQHFNQALVATGVKSSEIKWAVGVVENIQNIEKEQMMELAAGLFTDLSLDINDHDPKKLFLLNMIDGLSGREERVSELAAEVFDGINILGGSAGDDLKFKKTMVMVTGRVYENAAAFVLAQSDAPFKVIKHQHFIKSPNSIVVTKADPEKRVVHEFNGYSAAEGLAMAMGIPVEMLTGEVAFLKPLGFVCKGDPYVRSVQSINPDGSITFYCGIEEGMILNLLDHNSMTGALGSDLAAQLNGQKYSFFLGFNCILRSLEAKSADCYTGLGKVLCSHFENVVGFDTYGEQLNGMHINQTLVGIALKEIA